MPFGIENETPEQTKFMESCVGKITGTNKRTGKAYTKGEKIAICKVQLKKSGTAAVSETSLRELENKIYEALNENTVTPAHDYTYLEDLYDDYMIINRNGEFFKVLYTVGADVVIDWSSAVEVERKVSYEPVQAETQPIKVPEITVKRDGGRVVTIGGKTIN